MNPKTKTFFLREIIRQLPLITGYPFVDPFKEKPQAGLVAMACDVKKHLSEGKQLQSWPKVIGPCPSIGLAKAKTLLVPEMQSFVKKIADEVARLAKVQQQPLTPPRTGRRSQQTTMNPGHGRRTVVLKPKTMAHVGHQRAHITFAGMVDFKPDVISAAAVTGVPMDPLYGLCGEGSVAVLPCRRIFVPRSAHTVSARRSRLLDILDGDSSESDSGSDEESSVSSENIGSEGDSLHNSSDSDAEPMYWSGSEGDSLLDSSDSDAEPMYWLDVVNNLLEANDPENTCESILLTLPVPKRMASMQHRYEVQQLRFWMESLSFPGGLWADIYKSYWDHVDLC
jgi:hypothetical protein